MNPQSIFQLVFKPSYPTSHQDQVEWKCKLGFSILDQVYFVGVCLCVTVCVSNRMLTLMMTISFFSEDSHTFECFGFTFDEAEGADPVWVVATKATTCTAKKDTKVICNRLILNFPILMIISENKP